jgi:hypothetical protein
LSENAVKTGAGIDILRAAAEIAEGAAARLAIAAE